MPAHPSGKDGAVAVQPVLLVLSALLIPILATAFVMLYLFPDNLGAEHFAWPISPLMSSMMLGATYLGGACFFALALASRRWQDVWLGFLPVSVFAGTMGLATLLHWEPFSHDRPAFVLWAFLYFTVPLILPILWYRNQRLAAGAGAAWAARREEGALPRPSRLAFGALGVVLTGAGVLLFLFPETMAGTWPWTLSALTARVMVAIFVLPGLAGLSMWYDGSWSGARLLLAALAVTIVLMLGAVVVARGDFDWGYVGSWLFVGGLSLVLALVGGTYLAARGQGVR